MNIDKQSQLPPSPVVTTAQKKYQCYEEVPWSRRSGTNTIFILINILTCGFVPLTLWTCFNLLRGNVYYNKKDADGNLKTWSFLNKIAAAIIVAINLVYLIIALSGFVSALLGFVSGTMNNLEKKHEAERNQCITNLRMIESAKFQWALEKNKKGDVVPTWDDLAVYFSSKPVCLKGGIYTIGNLYNEPPKCSLGEKDPKYHSMK